MVLHRQGGGLSLDLLDVRRGGMQTRSPEWTQHMWLDMRGPSGLRAEEELFHPGDIQAAPGFPIPSLEEIGEVVAPSSGAVCNGMWGIHQWADEPGPDSHMSSQTISTVFGESPFVLFCFCFFNTSSTGAYGCRDKHW